MEIRFEHGSTGIQPCLLRELNPIQMAAISGGVRDTEKQLPPNSPEKIIFCVDLDKGTASTGTAQRGMSRLEHIKHAVSCFIHAKSLMSPGHSYAICALVESALWYLDFTTDVSSFLDQLLKLDSSDTFDCFDTSSLFNIIHDKLPMLEGNNAVMRAILLYTRSTVVPELSLSDAKHKVVFNHPRFFYDTLYLHDSPTPDNRPQDVYDALVSIEHAKNDSYLFENSTNIRKFYYNMMLLLAHPLQRPSQDVFHASLGKPDAE